MDTKEMRDRMRQRAAESGVMKQKPVYSARPKRVRSYKSLIINLIALVGLFALVFVLQQLGTRHAEKAEQTKPTQKATQVTAAEITLEEQSPTTAPVVPAEQKPEDKIQNEQVAMVEIETTEEGAAQPKAQAKIILKTKKTKKVEEAKTVVKPRKTAKTRTYHGQTGREDRLRSASLVDMLDGPNANRSAYSTSRTYATTTPQQKTTYIAPYRSNSVREDRRRSAELVDTLDSPDSQPAVRRAKRLNWANDVPMASASTRTTYSGIEETTLTSQTGTRAYATAAPQEKPTYVAPSQRPAWDVNVGENR